MEILQINEEINFANGIIRKEVHSHQPYASTTFNNNDEIRIPVQQQDIFTLPHESFLYVEGKVKHESDTSVSLSNNSIAFLFDEIRYELNGIEIDRSKNVGITSTIKSLLSVNDAESKFLENAAWNPHDYSNRILSSDGGYFNVCIPLKMLLGFAEDYKKIIVNARQELILVRAKNDENAFITTAGADASIIIEKIQWRLPYVHVSDSERLALLKHVEMNKSIYIPFRTWELYEYPLLPPSQNQLWTVKTTTQLEKPRFVILAFQTARKNQVEKDSSLFDHCQLTNVKLYLNSECFPYENLNLNFDRDQYALLYSMYSEFQKSYYERNAQPLLSRNEFKTRAMAVIDCSNQNESIKTGSVDVRIEFESSVNFPPKTSAYCLIIHDRVVEYNPLTNYVNKIV